MANHGDKNKLNTNKKIPKISIKALPKLRATVRRNNTLYECFISMSSSSLRLHVIAKYISFKNGNVLVGTQMENAAATTRNISKIAKQNDTKPDQIAPPRCFPTFLYNDICCSSS